MNESEPSSLVDFELDISEDIVRNDILGMHCVAGLSFPIINVCITSLFPRPVLVCIRHSRTPRDRQERMFFGGRPWRMVNARRHE